MNQAAPARPRPWPRDVPPPAYAPRGERGRRPALLVPRVSKWDALRDLIRWQAEHAAEQRAVIDVLARLALLFLRHPWPEQIRAAEEWNGATARALDDAAMWHALYRGACVDHGVALAALHRASERLVDAEARLGAARAALPALMALAAHPRASEAARAAVEAMRVALEGGA